MPNSRCNHITFMNIANRLLSPLSYLSNDRKDAALDYKPPVPPHRNVGTRAMLPPQAAPVKVESESSWSIFIASLN